MESLRIQKYLSDCGVMSRRAAEKEIAAGRVKVNGAVAQIGQKIDPDTDEVVYKGKVVKKEIKSYTYIMLNKPVGYVTTMSDESSRPCVRDLVSDVGVRVYPVGRLDMYSEGLLIMTNDGELTNKLTHPKHEIPKIYHVKVDEEINSDKLRFLGRRMNIDGYDIEPVKCEVVTRKDGFTVLRMTLYEGRNRQIRKMCEAAELKVLSLKRIAIGELSLGNLKPGEWKKMSASQIKYLRGGK